MNILIGCECSGITRDAFIKQGHNAISCDLDESELPGPHLQCDIFSAVRLHSWDLIILHPPCDYMAVCGNRWYTNTKKRRDAQDWTMRLWCRAIDNAEHVALENPVSTLSRLMGKAHQVIQPHQFGHGEQKAICWWLHNLPKLKPTRNVKGRTERIWRMPPSETRKKDRSRWFTGIARAEATQWPEFINNQRGTTQ